MGKSSFLWENSKLCVKFLQTDIWLRKTKRPQHFVSLPTPDSTQLYYCSVLSHGGYALCGWRAPVLFISDGKGQLGATLQKLP